MTLFGLLWVIVAPLSLLAAMVIGAIVLPRRIPALRSGKRAQLAAALVVLLPVGLIYLQDRMAFRSVCTSLGRPVIRARAVADGVVLRSGTVNSFGMRYLQEEGFVYIEGEDYRVRDSLVRYERAPDGTISDRRILTYSAPYEVSEAPSQPFPHTFLTITSVKERATGREMARAGHANFDGGRTKWVIGMWGTASCPSPMTDQESWSTWYHLANRTLRPRLAQAAK